MKKIIFGITGLTLGGAERVLVDIANRLTETFDVTIFTIYAKGELEKELNDKVHLTSLYNFKYNEMKGLKKIITPIKILLNKRNIFRKYIDNKDYVVHIAFLEGPITRIFSVKSKIKKIAWIHNDISKVFGKGSKSKIKRILDRNVYEKYNQLVFVSKDNLDRFNRTYDDILLPHETVINNYINAERIIELAQKPIDENDEKLFEDVINSKKQSKKNISNNVVNLVQVSRLVEQKAIDRLINVHSKLIKQGYKHRIFVIGDGSLKGKLEEQIQKEGVADTFRLLGGKTNPYPYVKKADYFCLFSNFEGYPMVVEEAKILRKYILTTNTATREVLLNYPGYSQIVSNDEQGIEKAIKFAIKNKNLEKNNEYIYENNKIIDKITKVIEKNID